ncbi:hypothetical protein SprV_0301056700 [Sparganum proliferum]
MRKKFVRQLTSDDDEDGEVAAQRPRQENRLTGWPTPPRILQFVRQLTSDDDEDDEVAAQRPRQEDRLTGWPTPPGILQKKVDYVAEEIVELRADMAQTKATMAEILKAIQELRRPAEARTSSLNLPLCTNAAYKVFVSELEKNAGFAQEVVPATDLDDLPDMSPKEHDLTQFTSEDTVNGVKSREPDPEFLAVFRNLFEGREFHSYDELQKSMSLLSTKTGASYIRRHTTKLPPEDEGSRRCVYKRLLYECKHAGTFRSRATQGICRKSKMMNCPSRINFLYEGNGLRLVTFNLTHNHLLTPQPTPVIPKKRRCDQFSPLPADSYCQPSNIASGIQNGRHDDLNALGPVSWSPPANPHNNMSESVKRSHVMNLVDQLWDVASTSQPADLEEGASRLRDLIDWWKKDGN